jgi:hypothetical protein
MSLGTMDTPMSKAKAPALNVELLDKVLERIEAKPDLWNQENWIKPPEGTGYVTTKTVVVDGKEMQVLPITCDTAFCFAGWAVFLERPDLFWTRGQQVVGSQEDLDWWDKNAPDDVDSDYDSLLTAPYKREGVIIADPGAVAARLIGLSYEQANRLFDGDNDLAGLRRRVAQIKAGEPVDRGGDV